MPVNKQKIWTCAIIKSVFLLLIFCMIHIYAVAQCIVTSPQDTAVCIGGNASFSVITMGGTLTYKWQIHNGISWNNVNDGGTTPNYNGSTNDTLQISNIPYSCNNYFYRCIVSGISCGIYPDTSENANLTVYPQLTGGAIADNQSICYNSTPGIFTSTNLPTGGTGNYTYQWQKQANCTGTWSNITGANNSTCNYLVSLVQKTCFRRRVTNICGTVYSNTLQVTVYEQLLGGEIDSDQTIPYNTSPSTFTNLSLPTGGTGSLTYQWQMQLSCSGAWSDIGGANGSTYNYPSNLTQNTCFRRVATNSCGSVNSNTITVIVQGEVTGGTIGTDQTICHNTTPAAFTNDATPTGGSGTYTYQWQIQPGCSGAWSNISGATGNVYTHPTPLTQQTCFRREATSSGQSALSNIVHVTVCLIFIPGVIQPNQTICYGDDPALFNEIYDGAKTISTFSCSLDCKFLIMSFAKFTELSIVLFIFQFPTIIYFFIFFSNY